MFYSLRLSNTAAFEETLQRWPDVGNTVTDLTGPRLEPPTSRSKDVRIIARSTVACFHNKRNVFYIKTGC